MLLDRLLFASDVMMDGCLTNKLAPRLLGHAAAQYSPNIVALCSFPARVSGFNHQFIYHAAVCSPPFNPAANFLSEDQYATMGAARPRRWHRLCPMEKTIMRKAIAASFLLLAGIAAGGAPALAEQSAASQVLFGKAYDDDVTAIQVAPIYGQGDGADRSIFSGNSATIRLAQSQASHDRGLQQALAVRGIALHNVLRVITAGNGGKIVYYR